MAKKVPSIVKEIRNNPPSPINYAYQKNISYSQMSIFRGCPHRWKLQYKDKIKRFTSSIHTVFGTAMHETLQMYLDVMYAESGAAADRLDKGLPANREIASAKLYATEMLARITDTAIQIHGGMGLMDDYPLERFWRDARVERIWDGTSEIQRHIISRDLLRPLGA